MNITSELQGTRNDLAKILRVNRHALKLRRSDVWEWDGMTTHTFIASQPVFRRNGMTRPTRILDFTIFPF